MSALAPIVLWLLNIATLQPLILWLLLLELLFPDLAIVHLEEHASCRHESLFDAHARLGRRFEETVEALFSGELLALGC